MLAVVTTATMMNATCTAVAAAAAVLLLDLLNDIMVAVAMRCVAFLC